MRGLIPVRKPEDYRPIRGDILHELPWISEFDFSRLKETQGAVRRYSKAGCTLLRQGSCNEDIFYVDQGRVRLSIYDPDGREKTLAIVTEGNVFGEVSAFDGCPSPVEVTAITDVVIYSVSRQMVQRDRELLYALFLYLVRENRLLLSQLQSLVFNDAYTRLAACLYRLCFKYGRSQGCTVRLPVHFTHEEMAALLGVSRVTVTNMLNKMRRDGLIEYRGGFVTVLQPDKLAAVGRVE